MSNFSFSIHAPITGSTTQATASKAPVKREPTLKQTMFYQDLCIQKGVDAEDFSEWDYHEMSLNIQELMRIQRPSQAQLDLIGQKIENLASLGIDLEINVSSLTGGREGSASKAIEELIAKEKEVSLLMPIQPKQLETLVSWFMCPDIPFESYGISKKVSLGNQWRLMTPDEFAEEISKSLNKADANKVIDSYRGTFYNWKKTRAKLEQIKYIKQLQSRFTTVKSRKFETVVGFDGETFVTTDSKHEMADPNQYVSMSDMELEMLSEDQASKMIDILKSELENKDLYSGSLKADDGSETFEPLRYRSDDRGNVIQSDAEWVVREMDKSIYKLESIVGYKLDEIREQLDENVLEEGWNEFKTALREAMLLSIDEGDVTYSEMVNLFQDETHMLDILFARDADMI